MSETRNYTLFLWARFLSLFFLFVVGFCFLSILHFSLEDAFRLPLSVSFFQEEFFGFEYATYLSWLLVLGGLFLLADFYTRKCIRRTPALFSSDVWRVLLSIFFGVNLLIFCTKLVIVFYGFFSGRTSEQGLTLNGVTLLFMVLSFVYVYIHLFSKTFLLSKLYSFFICCFIAGSVVASLWLTLYWAPPSVMRHVRIEQKALSMQTDKLPNAVASYYNAKGKLPQEVKSLSVWNESNEKARGLISYKIQSPKEFRICVNLQTKSFQARRFDHNRRVSSRTTPGERQGFWCRSFTLTPDKENFFQAHASEFVKVADKA